LLLQLTIVHHASSDLRGQKAIENLFETCMLSISVPITGEAGCAWMYGRILKLCGGESRGVRTVNFIEMIINEQSVPLSNFVLAYLQIL
jgi:hypothetical protein